MTRIVFPFNREDEWLETKAHGCGCICNESVAPHSLGQAGAWIPIIPGCGCICNSTTANNCANSNIYHGGCKSEVCKDY